MTSSPDLIHELEASRPSAPVELRARIRELAAEQAAPAPWPRWRPVRRTMLVALPAAAALAFASAGVLGLARSDTPQSVEVGRVPVDTTMLESTEPPVAGALTGPAQGTADATTGNRAQRVSAMLTVEVPDSDAVS